MADVGMTPEMALALLINGRKNAVEAIKISSQLSNNSKYFDTVIQNLKDLSPTELLKVGRLLNELLSYCSQICNKHGFKILEENKGSTSVQDGST